MKILYFCADPGVPVYGPKGCSVHVQEVISVFRELGHTVEVFATNLGDQRAGNVEGLNEIPLSAKTNRAQRESDLYKINRVVPDLLNRAGRFDLLYERHSLWSYAAMDYARTKGIPSVLEVNAPLIEEERKYRELIHQRRAHLSARRAFSNATVVTVVSSAIVNYVRAIAGNKCRVRVVPNGVNPNRFPRGLTPAVGKEKGVFTVGFVGSLKPWHGLSVLAESIATFRMRYSNVRLLIVGDGPERSNFEEMLRAKNLLQSTVFTGAVAPGEIPALLASMDAAIAPYAMDDTHYFSPLKIYEYMAAGLPVVASKVGQIADLIEDERNGLLISPVEPTQFARALERLIRDPNLCQRLGMAARTAVLRDHSWRQRANRILHLVNRGLPLLSVMAAV